MDLVKGDEPKPKYFSKQFARDYLEPEHLERVDYINPHFLNRARLSRGLSSKEMAMHLHVSTTQYVHWELGREEMPTEMIFKVMATTGYPKSFFYRQAPRQRPQAPLFIKFSDD